MRRPSLGDDGGIITSDFFGCSVEDGNYYNAVTGKCEPIVSFVTTADRNAPDGPGNVEQGWASGGGAEPPPQGIAVAPVVPAGKGSSSQAQPSVPAGPVEAPPAMSVASSAGGVGEAAPWLVVGMAAAMVLAAAFAR